MTEKDIVFTEINNSNYWNLSNCNNSNEVEIILWLNGKSKEYSFKYLINQKNEISLSYLKEQITEKLKKMSIFKLLKKNLIIHNLYNMREIELEDIDIPYLKNNEIIFFTLNNSKFKSINHYNQYEFIRWIKSGGYGEVYLAKHIISNKEYAIKQIDISNFTSEELYKLSRENMILKSLKHKNVIKCIDSFSYDNKYFTVMEYAQGGELTDLLKNKEKLSEKECKSIFIQIYDAVKYIHENNIIHRDLKPSNILFLDKEKTHIVIIDFGISGFSNGNQKEEVKAGTIKFMPPESVSNIEYGSDTKFDMWSLGIILYRMIEGVYPFDGKNKKEIIKNIVKGNLEFNKNIIISYPLRILIEGLLEKNSKFRIDNNSDLFTRWFKFCDEQNNENINDSNCIIKNNKSFLGDKVNYLSRKKRHLLKKLPTNSYNHFFMKINNHFIKNSNNNLYKSTKKLYINKKTIDVEKNYHSNNKLTVIKPEMNVSKIKTSITPILSKISITARDKKSTKPKIVNNLGNESPKVIILHNIINTDNENNKIKSESTLRNKYIKNIRSIEKVLLLNGNW